VIGLDWQSE